MAASRHPKENTEGRRQAAPGASPRPPAKTLQRLAADRLRRGALRQERTGG